MELLIILVAIIAIACLPMFLAVVGSILSAIFWAVAFIVYSLYMLAEAFVDLARDGGAVFARSVVGGLQAVDDAIFRPVASPEYDPVAGVAVIAVLALVAYLVAGGPADPERFCTMIFRGFVALLVSPIILGPLSHYMGWL